ncbi:hypothetical protein A2379_02395 [Candidatus Amesbacteria bacterium RIFOXYB1_FULL_47_13]|nr:MAG: hypothetical protein A2379_02395 [Candidatus Amesbacteria bacterium RIFOXYB1_FULL_47_13]HBC72871.1 galactokinase [Candidatus Amesbacteria bacterium]
MIMVRAPFRIPLGGGGTDLPSYYTKFGGRLISVSINKYIYTTANRPVSDKLIRLKYSDSETVDSVNEVNHDLAKEALKLTGVTKNVELAWVADLPHGTGMGSSGSFLVSTLKALYDLKGEVVSSRRLAEDACKIEIEILKKPVGKQDQYMAAFGGLTRMEINKKGQVEVIKPDVSPHALRDLENSFVLFFTGISRASGKILSKQNRSTTKNDSQVINNLHFIKELGDEIFKALENGKIEQFGKLLDVHWQYKRKLSKAISSVKIDNWYEQAKDAGALGGKIIGAGGGGFLLFCCPGDKSKLRKSMSKAGLTEMLIHFDNEGVKTLVNF